MRSTWSAGGRRPRKGLRSAMRRFQARRSPADHTVNRSKAVGEAVNPPSRRALMRAQESADERERAQRQRGSEASEPAADPQHQTDRRGQGDGRLAGVSEPDREGEAGDALPAALEGAAP